MSHLLNRRTFLCRCAIAGAGSLMFSGISLPSPSRAAALKKGAIGRKLSPYYTTLDDHVIQCDLCPHECEVEEGARGICEVRENIGGKYYSLVYGNPCSLNVDPVEKKPFYHVLPTTQSFSIATAGCNFDCNFCQNWEIAQALPEETYNYELTPEQVVRLALRYKCTSIASTYVEPTVFTEYMLEIGRLTRTHPLLKVMHSNGFINPKPLDDLCAYLDAACIDLKAFTESFYRDVSEGRLQPVLDTLKRLKVNGVHTELVNLIVPGKNDDMADIRKMCEWIRTELGPDAPLHFSRFYPRYKLKSTPPTSLQTLEQARKLAMDEGLNYVYLGNVPEHPGGHTYCPKCKKMLIKRIGYNVKVPGMENGHCKYCGKSIAGIWKQREPSFTEAGAAALEEKTGKGY